MSAEHLIAALMAGSANYNARAAADAAKAQRNRWDRLSQVLSSGKIAAAPAKCPGCGSHEFRQHHGRTICAYCRTDGR